MPCDTLVMSGDLLMNESTLTGESLPIPKYPVDSGGD